MKSKYLLLLMCTAIVLGSCKQLQQMAMLRKCQFRIESVRDTQLAGIRIQQIKSFSDLSLGDAARVTAGWVSGNLPLDFVLNVQVRNPNTQLAAMNKFDWIAMVDDLELLNGTVHKRVEVAPNGGVATIPLNIRVNLKEVLSKLSKNQVLNFGFGMSDSNNKPTRVALKMKPSIQVGQRAISYPGWFTVKRDFTAGN